ncbi:FIG00711868: hypothetical protein [Helicobacter bizzozeronii CIII-1]|uniref:Uncharacterized protein n=1 Tax=Helicobacter bizzozeronii (strain CIII-1) TaxID=1002804 RepID=F8KPW0_HELBC|nr:class I SAM-dependent methyltransferase [Helicobacter bizzozeronii]CCB80854.1 FIG00711868: hypothetical protein [Helicobacter bizzozeronii CIII-1]
MQNYNFQTLSEEPLKAALYQRYFKSFSYSAHKIDFVISKKHPQGLIPLIWAEGKKGKSDLQKSFTQLLLTIGKHRFFTHETPLYLGVFDAYCFAFVRYDSDMTALFYQDINFNTTPSNHNSPEFLQCHQLFQDFFKPLYFQFATQEKELAEFIKHLAHTPLEQIPIDTNNFVHVYHKWLESVKPSISIDWKKAGDILDTDFYLADLLSAENNTLPNKLNTLLKNDHYAFNKIQNLAGFFNFDSTGFKDNQQAHKEFWSVYKRPPAQEFWDHILERRDLLVPLDVRERKGAFCTPKIWVEKSQEYLRACLGAHFQEEYYIWDLAAGTGNLLLGLSNPERIYASTLDQNDVGILKQRAANKQLPILEDHIFKFDFLDDSFDKLPDTLQAILKDPNKCAKLIIYINPPYAEAGSKTQIAKTGKNKGGVANSPMAKTYAKELGKAKNELFAQFFMRIIKEIALVKSQPKEAPLAGESSYEDNHTNLSPKKESLMYNTRSEPLPCLAMAGSLKWDVAPLQGHTDSTKSPLKIHGPILASFSKLKYLNSSNFKTFRAHFKARFLGGFMVPASSFDNVKGSFPIGFLVWDLGRGAYPKNPELEAPQEGGDPSTFLVNQDFKPQKRDLDIQYGHGVFSILAHANSLVPDLPPKRGHTDFTLTSLNPPIFLDIYDLAGNFLGVKGFGAHLDRTKSIIEWLRGFYDKKGDTLAYMKMAGSDIQHNNTVNLDNTLSPNDIKKHLFTCVSAKNLLPMSVYFAVRHCTPHTWINDRDQFYAPYNDTWQHDLEFLHDCLAFMLFHTQNRISCVHGINHFIPFSETSINAKAAYKSHALLDFLKGKPKAHLFSPLNTPPNFSPKALELLQAGQALYAYYHHLSRAHPRL